MSNNISKYFVRVAYNGAVVTIPTDYCRFSTTAFEEAVMFLPGEFREWKVVDHDEAPAVTRYASKSGGTAIAKLYKGDTPVSDFEEEDKPKRMAPFTVFGDNAAIPCDSASAVASVVAQMIINYNRRPKVINARTA